MILAVAFSLLNLSLAAGLNISQPIVPKVDLEYWNTDSRILTYNNCYNYSTNRVTNSFAQPGEASNADTDEYDCAHVIRAAAADLGVVRTKFFPFQGRQDDALIALVVRPGYDYHWYRRGPDNMWTHKMGGSPATDEDNKGQKISDPEKADRGPYTEFCGYFRVINLPKEEHEQNAGQVRIGNMSGLPGEENKSTVERLLYSGRRNPQSSLRELLKDPDFYQQLLQVRAQMATAFLASQSQVRVLSRLGDRGILIVDREGLIFPPGSRVRILGEDILVFAADSVVPVGFKLPGPMKSFRAF